MKTPLARPSKASDDLIAMIAHDLRTSITTIKGFSQLALRQTDATSPVTTYLEVVVHEANRIAALLEDLVLASEYERAPSLLQSTRIDLRHIATEATRRSNLLSRTSHSVIDPESANVTAWGDGAATERGLSRLISAAMRYSTNKCPVTISTRHGPGEAFVAVAVSVSANWNRLPALQRAIAVSDNDTPLDATVEASGLGLYICRRLIEVQGGRVWIEQSPDVGIRFVVALPDNQNASPGGDH